VIEFSESLIQMWLMWRRHRRSFVLPNYTPAGWWECDVFELRTSGYFVEYEIKISLSDFRADREKAKEDRWLRSPKRMKHEELLQRSTSGPSRFFYVVPEGLIGACDVPEWSGLIVMRRSTSRHSSQLFEEVAKPAPRLHQQKLQPKIEEHARSVIYYRFHDLLYHTIPRGTPMAGDSAVDEPE